VSALHDGEELLAHTPRLLDGAAIASAARLPLRNERLQAELRTRLGDLRAMRGRIVAAADGERRQLERDLHDGAQQGLASLAVAVEAARARTDDPSLAQARAEIRGALAALREVAHGLVPAVLADEGLAEAVAAFAETVDALVHLPDALPPGRLAPEVETTAYHVIVEAVRRAESGEATVRAARGDGRLVVSIDAVMPPADQLQDLDDRVGALGGELRIDPVSLVVELPCA
jgi:signal transduction histidine kinase